MPRKPKLSIVEAEPPAEEPAEPVIRPSVLVWMRPGENGGNAGLFSGGTLAQLDLVAKILDQWVDYMLAGRQDEHPQLVQPIVPGPGHQLNPEFAINPEDQAILFQFDEYGGFEVTMGIAQPPTLLMMSACASLARTRYNYEMSSKFIEADAHRFQAMQEQVAAEQRKEMLLKGVGAVPRFPS